MNSKSSLSGQHPGIRLVPCDRLAMCLLRPKVRGLMDDFELIWDTEEEDLTSLTCIYGCRLQLSILKNVHIFTSRSASRHRGILK